MEGKAYGTAPPTYLLRVASARVAALFHLGSMRSCLSAFLVGSAVGLSLRILFFFLATVAVDPLAMAAEQVLTLAPLSDPIYTRAAVHSLGSLEIEGLAVQAPLGDLLHEQFPDIVVESDRTEGGLVRLAVEPGSAVLARLSAASIAHTAVLLVGLLLVHAGYRRRRLSLGIAGVAVQAQVALGIVGATPSIADLEATGLSFAVNVLLPWLTGRRVALTDLVSGIPTPLVDASLVFLAMAIDYALAGVLLVAARTSLRLLRALRPSPTLPTIRHLHRPTHAVSRTFASTLAVALVAAGLAGACQLAEPATAPLGDAQRLAAAPGSFARLALANEGPLSPSEASQPQVLSSPLVPNVASAPVVADIVRDSWALESHTSSHPPLLLPRRIEIVGGQYRYQYRVNGTPQVIHGMGLNTQYARRLTPEARRAQLESDFTTFNRLGVNTVLGWEPGEFEHPLLDIAQAHQIGVVMPFYLDPNADYTDATFRIRLTEEVLAWVRKYRDYPALRMWGLGNEVLHKIVHPAWMGPQDPARVRNARAFADWLVATADAIHALDPDHPVTYREAEDAFVPWVARAIKRTPETPRPWFVWGVNSYTDYMAQIVEYWPTQGMDVPLWISEFAPGGLAVPDRPEGFQKLWGYVRRHPRRVLGGAVYAWTRTGPEEIDRTFGLTDDGEPVDGRSLDMLASLFHGDTPPRRTAGVR